VRLLQNWSFATASIIMRYIEFLEVPLWLTGHPVIRRQFLQGFVCPRRRAYAGGKYRNAVLYPVRNTRIPRFRVFFFAAAAAPGRGFPLFGDGITGS
jgi:hypothetical protein